MPIGQKQADCFGSGRFVWLARCFANTCNCHQSAGVAVRALLLQAIAGAKVNNLRDYIDVGPGPGEPFLQVDIENGIDGFRPSS
jgi:hypothetical protein